MSLGLGLGLGLGVCAIKIKESVHPLDFDHYQQRYQQQSVSISIRCESTSATHRKIHSIIIMVILIMIGHSRSILHLIPREKCYFLLIFFKNFIYNIIIIIKHYQKSSTAGPIPKFVFLSIIASLSKSLTSNLNHKSDKIAIISATTLFVKKSQRVVEEKLVPLLRSCKTTKHLRQIQAQVITHGLQHSDYVTPRIITACAQLKEMTYAHNVFDKIPNPNVVSWNAMLKGYAQNEMHRYVVFFFGKMNKLDVMMPNCFTFPVVLNSCVKINALREGEEVHCLVVKHGFSANIFVGTALIELYTSGRVIEAAYKVFRDMVVRNVVVWTSMINGYLCCGDIDSARCLFDLAPKRDVILWNTMVSGYIELGNMVEARKLFDQMPKKDVMSWNTMLIGYANNGNVEECKKLFEEMPERNVFSWNGLIGGYAHNGCFFGVLDTFKRMLTGGRVIPNEATIVTVLSACASFGALEFGKWVHVYAESNGYKGSVFVGNALIDMYAKCGIMEKAVDVFKGMDKRDLITWNTIIGGLAMHGRGADALSLFSEMKKAGEVPDGITFIGILCACTHMGLVEDGLSYFQSMVEDYSIVPQIKHYGCVIDLLARAGRLVEAVDFVRMMPIEADAVIWANLLGSCRVHKNVELAELALERLIELEPNNPANFVMLSNIYGDLGRWKDVARAKIAMRDTRLKKIPGCSSIEVNEVVVEFYSLDERHPKTEEIHETLKGLTKLLRSSGYVPDIQVLEQGT